MAEENDQSLEENNIVTEDKKEWKKWIIIIILVVIAGIILIYGMVNSINHKKEKNEAREVNAIAQKLIEAANSGAPVETSMTYHSETEKTDDDSHIMRIEDYEMKYKGKFFDSEFERKFENRKEFPEIELSIPEESSLKSVVVNSYLEDELMKITVKAENYSDDDIKYEFDGNNIKIYGATQIISRDTKKDISFSQIIYLPAPPIKDKIQISKQGDELLYIVPLNIED